MNIPHLLLFIVIWTACLYVYNCVIARQIIVIKPIRALFYIAAMAMLGVIGEVIIDSIYFLVNAKPLWEYHILPVHHAYTSQYSLAIWGMVGFHLYLLHTTLEKKGVTSIRKLTFIFCIEAIVLEAIVNISFIALFGGYLYYYLPSDLNHVTSLQVLPLYLIAGFISVYTLQLLQKKPAFYITPCALLAVGFVYGIRF